MASDMKLYQLGAELEDIISQIVENDGVISDEIGQQLDSLNIAFDDKVERVVMAIRAHQARAKMVSAEIERLYALASPHVRAADSLKAYLFTQMQRVGKHKVDRPLGKAWIQRSKASINYVGRDPEGLSDVPAAFVRVTRELDKQKAYEAYKAQQSLPGCLEVTESSHLRVK